MGQSRSFLDMERVLIICAILAFQFIQAEPTGPCECNDHTEKGKRDSLLGRCLKTSSNCPDSGTWCYIDDNSKCEDAKKSKKADVPYKCHQEKGKEGKEKPSSTK